MRKVLLKSAIAAVFLLSCPVINAQTKQGTPVLSKTMCLTSKNCANIKSQRMTPVTGQHQTRLPKKITEYNYDNDNWNVKEIKDITYNDQGYAISEIVQRARYDGTFSYMRNTFEYNENGMVTSSMREVSKDEMATWTNNKLNTFEYDDIVNDAIIMQGVFKWDATNEIWNQQTMDPKNVFREIVRDENGRVIQDQWWDTKDKSISSIGYYLKYEDGDHASKMYLKETDKNNEMRTSYEYRNIKWYKCNDQIMYLSPNIYHVFAQEKENLVSSYEIYQAGVNGSLPQLMGEYSAIYDDMDRRTSVKIVMPYDQMFEGIYEYDTQGEGSYVSIERNWIEKTKNGILDDDENVMFDCKVVMKYDEFGNLILNDRYDADFDGTYIHSGGYMSEYKYAEDGTMLERIDKQYDKNINDWKFMAKFVYENFTDVVTAVENARQQNVRAFIEGNSITVENADGYPYTVIAADGRQVKSGVVASSKINLSGIASGAYVVKIGNNLTFKMMK